MGVINLSMVLYEESVGIQHSLFILINYVWMRNENMMSMKFEMKFHRNLFNILSQFLGLLNCEVWLPIDFLFSGRQKREFRNGKKAYEKIDLIFTYV